MKANRHRTVAALAVTASLLVAGLVAGPAQAALKHYDGTVLGKSSSANTFRIKTEGGSKLTFKVNGRTEFERISGFGGLDRGLAIEVLAKKKAGDLVARKIEPRGGGGNGGGSADDPRPHG